jgi:hypothetical protein
LENYASTVWRRLWELDFHQFYYQQSEMVDTRSHPPLEIPFSAAVGASNNQDMTDFMK